MVCFTLSFLVCRMVAVAVVGGRAAVVGGLVVAVAVMLVLLPPTVLPPPLFPVAGSPFLVLGGGWGRSCT